MKTKKHKTPKSHSAKKQNVLVAVVVDKSGSMSTCVNETITGFNEYLAGLRKEKEVNYAFSLTLFDTEFTNRHVAVPLDKVENLTAENYVPSGFTALYDAIGSTVRAIDHSGVKFDKSIVVILTDGQENSSREYRLEQIKATIQAKEAQGNWTFVFLGADLNAPAVGMAMGVQVANSSSYDPAQSKAMYSTLGHATRTLSRCSASASVNFFSGTNRGGLRKPSGRRTV